MLLALCICYSNNINVNIILFAMFFDSGIVLLGLFYEDLACSLLIAHNTSNVIYKVLVFPGMQFVIFLQT